DNREAFDPIAASETARLEPYRRTMDAARAALDTLGIHEKVTKAQKPTLLELCRNRFPEEALAWLDAAYLLSSSKPKYPPLLGTGGNDGALDFTNNFMKQLLRVIAADT